MNSALRNSKTNIEEPAKEFALFRAGGERTSRLQRARETLLSIQPTSVQPERDFSVLSDIIGKKRASLRPQTIDDIFMLRKAFECEVTQGKRAFDLIKLCCLREVDVAHRGNFDTSSLLRLY